MGEIAKVIKTRERVADKKITGFCRDFFFSDDFDFDVGEKKDDPNHVLDDEIAAGFRLLHGLLQIDEERDEPTIDQKESEENKPIKNGEREWDEKSPKVRIPTREIIGQ